MKRLSWAPMAALGAMTMVACSDSGNGGEQEPHPYYESLTSWPGPTDGDTEGTGPDDGDLPGMDDPLDVNGPDTGPIGCGDGDRGCTDKIDLLFIIDNSGTMAVEQANLARNFPRLVRQLEELEDSQGNPVNPDVQIMVTTTDYGNPECNDHNPDGYVPSRGQPISTACTDRLDRFTGLGSDPDIVPEACKAVCPTAVAPSGAFVAFNADGSNVPDVPPSDVDGDGEPDSAVAQALACIGPQGIDGCGFEAPLENMMQSLNPGAEWNGAGGFLRPDALLAIAIISDEADCSVLDYDIMTDPAYQETDPDFGDKRTTSAVCWNAGVSCSGPDADGVYSGCSSTSDNGLQPITRYTDYLINELRQNQNKEVVMLGILGVPEVTAHSDVPPYEPTAGGVLDLVYRDWRDGLYDGTDLGGDILPDEFNDGVTAAKKHSDFGVGPGCTGGDAAGGFTGQAIPPVRIKEVCESLNIDNDDGTTDVRCCIESICDDDFSSAVDCLAGIIGEAIVVPG